MFTSATSIHGALRQNQHIQTCLSNYFETVSATSIPPAVSVAAILIFEACTKSRRSERRWGKVRLLLKLLHKLGASCQMTTEQSETEQHSLRLTKEHVMPETPLFPIIDGVRNIDPYRRHEALAKAHNEFALFQQQRRKPLRLEDFAMISIRQAVGARHFIEKLYLLPDIKDEILSERRLHRPPHHQGI